VGPNAILLALMELSRIAADTQTPLPIEESPSLPPTATETEPAIPTDESGLTIPPSFTPATNEVTPQPTSQTPGTIHPTATIGAPPENSLENPVPAGTSVEVGDGFILTIVGFTLPADSIVSAADPLSLPPAPGEEYLQVVVELTCTKPPAENCEFFTGELLALRPDGELYVPDTTITGIEEMLQDGRIQGGTSETGEQYYLIPKDDPSIVMYYESFLNPESDVYYLAFQ
jgi:hypothetical protein